MALATIVWGSLDSMVKSSHGRVYPLLFPHDEKSPAVLFSWGQLVFVFLFILNVEDSADDHLRFPCAVAAFFFF